MEPLGWLIFLTSNGLVIGLLIFCFYKVFTIPQEHMASPLDIDTHDLGPDKEDENQEASKDKNED